uniref:Caprin-1 dimerization domain-containing protein n=1 Tax=Strongyloides stercoralis TaxID=6248 RepID=A0A0K0DUX4_STRER
MKAKVNSQSKLASSNDAKVIPEDAVFQNPYVSILNHMVEKKNLLTKELKKLRDIENQIIKGRESLFSKVELDSVKNIGQVSKCIELMDESIDKINEQVGLYGKKVSVYKNSLKTKKAEEDIELLQNFMFLKSTINKFSDSNLRKYTDGLTSDLKITKEQAENCALLVNDFNCEKFTSNEEEFKEETKASFEKVYRVITGSKKAAIGDVFGRKCRQILVDFAEKCNTFEGSLDDVKDNEITIDEGIDTATETPNQVTPSPDQKINNESSEVNDKVIIQDVKVEEAVGEKEMDNEDKYEKKSNESDETRYKENNYRKHNGGRKRWQNRNFNGDKNDSGLNTESTTEQKQFGRYRNDKMKRTNNENGEQRGEKKFNQHFKRSDGDYTRKPLRNGGENRSKFDGQKQYGGRPHHYNNFRHRGQNKKEQTSGNGNQNGNSN